MTIRYLGLDCLYLGPADLNLNPDADVALPVELLSYGSERELVGNERFLRLEYLILKPGRLYMSRELAARFSLSINEEAPRELVACFPVYRVEAADLRAWLDLEKVREYPDRFDALNSRRQIRAGEEILLELLVFECGRSGR